MNEPQTPTNIQQEQHNHAVLYTSLVLLVGAVALLLVVVGRMYYKGKQNPVAVQPQTQDQIQTDQTAKQTPQQQLQQSITPVPVETKQDLTTQLNTLNNTDMTAIGSGLDQNSADASQFSQ